MQEDVALPVCPGDPAGTEQRSIAPARAPREGGRRAGVVASLACWSHQGHYNSRDAGRRREDPPSMSPGGVLSPTPLTSPLVQLLGPRDWGCDHDCAVAPLNCICRFIP